MQEHIVDGNMVWDWHIVTFHKLYSTEGGTKHESGKGYTLSSGPGHFLVSLPCQTGERTKNKNI